MHFFYIFICFFVFFCHILTTTKKDITEIVYQIIDTYKTRIQNNEILEEVTKEKAILKLSKIGVKMGYPDKVQDIYNKFYLMKKTHYMMLITH